MSFAHQWIEDGTRPRTEHARVGEMSLSTRAALAVGLAAFIGPDALDVRGREMVISDAIIEGVEWWSTGENERAGTCLYCGEPRIDGEQYCASCLDEFGYEDSARG